MSKQKLYVPLAWQENAIGNATGEFRPVKNSEVLDYVRREVESGTIKGEVKVARNRLAGWNPVMEVSEPGPYLVVRIEGET